MPSQIVTIPCRSDNYAFLIHNDETGATALVDAPEAAAIQNALEARGWLLTDILITHHHHDHVEGVDALRSDGVRVIGAAADAYRLPRLDLAVGDGDQFQAAGQTIKVFDVSGHTVGHIAFHLPDTAHVFTADSLMALGCGRLFEGTPEQMWDSLSKLAALPPETVVCSGHEYTQSNGAFALTVDPDNEELKQRVDDVALARAQGKATVPSLLSLELATNPFLRADKPALKRQVGLPNGTDVEVFAEIRRRKDAF